MTSIYLNPNGRLVLTEPGHLTRPARHERQAPEDQAHCHKCGRTTGTTYRVLSSGHCGNLCSECGCCRLGKPYVSKRYLDNSPRPLTAAEGFHHGRTSR